MTQAKKQATKKVVQTKQQFTTALINEKAKSAFSTEEKWVMLDGEKVYFQADKKFRPTKVNQLLDDMTTYFAQGMSRQLLLDLASPYISLLLIKHFTSIDVSNDIDEALDTLQVMVDLQILAPIVNELEEKEIAKVFELIYKAMAEIEKNIDDMNSMTEEQIEALRTSEAFLKIQELAEKEAEEEATEEVTEDEVEDAEEESKL